MRHASANGDSRIVEAIASLHDEKSIWPSCVRAVRVELDHALGATVVLDIESLDDCAPGKVHALFCFEKHLRRTLEAAYSGRDTYFQLCAA